MIEGMELHWYWKNQEKWKENFEPVVNWDTVKGFHSIRAAFGSPHQLQLLRSKLEDINIKKPFAYTLTTTQENKRKHAKRLCYDLLKELSLQERVTAWHISRGDLFVYIQNANGKWPA